MLRKIRAQSTAEYAIILAVVMGAAVAMQVYVKRGLQARTKAGVDAVTGITATFAPEEGGGTSATFSTLAQYEPYYMESSYNRYQENVEQEHMGGGKVIKEKVSDITAAQAGGYQQQVDASSMTTRDAQWDTTATTP